MISPPSSTGPATILFKSTRQTMTWGAVMYGLGIVAGKIRMAPQFLVDHGCDHLCVFRGVSERPSVEAWLGVRLVDLLLRRAAYSALRHGTTSGHLILPFAERQEVTLTAPVVRDGRIRQNDVAEISESVDVETEEVQTTGSEQVPVHSRVRLSIYGPRSSTSDLTGEASDAGTTNAPNRALQFGERIRLIARLRAPRNFRNPGAFDYRGYLADRGIAALGSAKFADVEVLSGFTGNSIGLWRSRMHRSVLAKGHEI